MRNIRLTVKLKMLLAVLAVFGLTAATPQITRANPSGTAASGKYQLSFEDGYTKYVEFEAATQADGSVTGSMILTDETAIAEQDVDGTGDPDLNRSESGLVIKANFERQ